MITYHKQERWNTLASTFTRIVDGLGTGIDPGILETVIALNTLGVETAASCEGHLDHGTGAPWIDIEALSAREQSRQVAKLFTQADRAFEQQALPTAEIEAMFAVAHREKLRVKAIHLEQRKKLLEYLVMFYHQHVVPYDRVIVIHPRDTTGRARLESVGADLQNVAPLEIRAKKLLEYQQEMRDLTAFLKHVYFAELS